MKKFVKIAGILIGLLLLVGIALSLVVRFYLTDERLRALLIPRAEEAFGRKVSLAAIQVNLLRGIVLEDFAVKEADGTGDFFRAERFVLDYEFLPLLKRRLIISEVTLEQPFVRIERDKSGRFNFETLAFLQQPQEPETEPRQQDGMAALPLALTIDQIAINEARMVVADQLGELPAVDGSANVSISVDSGSDLASLRYHGRYDFTATVTQGELSPQLAGNGELNPETISYEIDTTIGDQQTHLSGAADNWREAPVVRLDISSEQLNVDRLLALLGGLSQPAPPGKEPPPSTPQPSPGKAARGSAPAEPLAAALPAGLTAQGRLNVGQALYQNLAVQDFSAIYDYAQGILNVKELSALMAGGKIVGQSRLDLTVPEPAYTGTLKLYALQAAELAGLLSERYGAWLTGTLNSAMEFSGRGSEWPVIRERLSLQADYAVKDGQLKELPLTAVIAELLGVPELRSLSFDQLAGNLQLKEGNVLLDSKMAGRDVRAEATGRIGLDGTLDVPLSLHLTGSLAEKVRSRASLARYLTDAEGTTTINLKLTGQISSPRPTLDMGAVRQKMKEQVEQKAYQELERFLQKKQPGEGAQEQPPPEKPAQPPVQDLLKGLFGK